MTTDVDEARARVQEIVKFPAQIPSDFANDLRALLAELDRLRAENEWLQGEVMKLSILVEGLPALRAKCERYERELHKLHQRIREELSGDVWRSILRDEPAR